MSQYKNPKWWAPEYDSAWLRTKAAFERDWDQTMHDVGGDRPDLNQSAKDTIKQAVGTETIPPRSQPNPDEGEPAYRFGYGARSYYGDLYPEWNDELEARLKTDWCELHPFRRPFWKEDLSAIRHAWEYQERDETKIAR